MGKSIHNTEYKTFIRLLRLLRESRNVTQEQLATKLGIAQGAISKIKSCERRLDLIETKSFCTALGISLVEFIVLLDKELQNDKPQEPAN